VGVPVRLADPRVHGLVLLPGDGLLDRVPAGRTTQLIRKRPAGQDRHRPGLVAARLEDSSQGVSAGPLNGEAETLEEKVDRHGTHRGADAGPARGSEKKTQQGQREQELENRQEGLPSGKMDAREHEGAEDHPDLGPRQKARLVGQQRAPDHEIDDAGDRAVGEARARTAHGQAFDRDQHSVGDQHGAGDARAPGHRRLGRIPGARDRRERGRVRPGRGRGRNRRRPGTFGRSEGFGGAASDRAAALRAEAALAARVLQPARRADDPVRHGCFVGESLLRPHPQAAARTLRAISRKAGRARSEARSLSPRIRSGSSRPLATEASRSRRASSGRPSRASRHARL
jgi:hypothetical protein